MMIVIFKLQIHGSFSGASSTDQWMTYQIELPFVPPIGMEVCDGDWCGVVDSLAYKDGNVFAFVESDKEIYYAQSQKQSHRTIEEIVKDYQETGWEKSDRVLAV